MEQVWLVFKLLADETAEIIFIASSQVELIKFLEIDTTNDSSVYKTVPVPLDVQLTNMYAPSI